MWRKFIRLHMNTLVACDFFTKSVITPLGTRLAYCLVFIRVGTRKVFLSPPTCEPNDRWVQQQAATCSFGWRRPAASISVDCEADVATEIVTFLKPPIAPGTGLDLRPKYKVYNAIVRNREDGQALLTIGQVAAGLGVPATTLRFYERERITGPSGRSTSGYRLYDAKALERIRFVRAAQAAGFTLADIQRLVQLSDEEPSTCRTVQDMIAARLAEVQNRMSDLKRVQEALQLALARCRRFRSKCPVLGELNSREMCDDSKNDARFGVGTGRRHGDGSGRGCVGETRKPARRLPRKDRVPTDGRTGLQGPVPGRRR